MDDKTSNGKYKKRSLKLAVDDYIPPRPSTEAPSLREEVSALLVMNNYATSFYMCDLTSANYTKDETS